VLLRKPRSYAEIYNDLDGEIVNVFRVVRDHGERLRLALELTPFSRREFTRAYLTTEDPIELARRCVVRSFMGFGSDGVHSSHRTGFRSNSNRSGSTPAKDWLNLPLAFAAIIDRLRGVVIEDRAAKEVMQRHDSPSTLHYVDPPYPHSTRKRVDAARGYRHEMSDDDHRAMAAMLHGLRGHVVVSGYRCDLYDRELFPRWKRVERKSHADGARERVEVLWIK
jgi:DNA adenine methylase